MPLQEKEIEVELFIKNRKKSLGVGIFKNYASYRKFLDRLEDKSVDFISFGEYIIVKEQISFLKVKTREGIKYEN